MTVEPLLGLLWDSGTRSFVLGELGIKCNFKGTGENKLYWGTWK